MIIRIGDPVILLALLTENGIRMEGKTVKVSVFDQETNVELLTDQQLTELAFKGEYSFEWKAAPQVRSHLIAQYTWSTHTIHEEIEITDRPMAITSAPFSADIKSDVAKIELSDSNTAQARPSDSMTKVLAQDQITSVKLKQDSNTIGSL